MPRLPTPPRLHAHATRPRGSVSTVVAPEKAEEYSDDEFSDLAPRDSCATIPGEEKGREQAGRGGGARMEGAAAPLAAAEEEEPSIEVKVTVPQAEIGTEIGDESLLVLETR